MKTIIVMACLLLPYSSFGADACSSIWLHERLDKTEVSECVHSLQDKILDLQEQMLNLQDRVKGLELDKQLSDMLKRKPRK